MSSELVRNILADNVSIPSLPSVVVRINALLEDPNAGTREVGAEIAKDAPLASKVLRLVNSAAYGMRQKVVSTEQASAVLGMRALRNLVLQVSVVGQFKHLEQTGFDLDGLWRHGILSAQLSQSLAKLSGTKAVLQPEEFYTCGLLHDLGQVLLLEHVGESYLLVVKKAVDEGRSLFDVENEVMGFSHAEIGARVALRWGLPGEIVSAIQFHHGPEDEIEAEPTVGIVDLANRTAHAILEQRDKVEALACLDAERAALLRLDQDAFANLVDSASESAASIEV
ncbi:HDOD domain-containing protein [Engelhardtia mirabilis]|uniref:Ribonuclease Y n=1 Tax=Engelhardtia mirabilis TaxID=2528011 RepID=A0A518BNW5_9BACT|nr:Ribonuclease Y [Planctomycetes bacterium Pla133]QDV03002.1 Ribonuclease Y [Planctomycetes bacterium Pla86]